MKVEDIDVSAAIEKVRVLLNKDKTTSPVLKAAVELIIKILLILLKQKKLNSRNSSKPPSQDPNRVRKNKKDNEEEGEGKKKQGGQNGHLGVTLDPVENPDEIKEILVDRENLPPGNYEHVRFEARQVFNVKITTKVIEYRVEVLKDDKGKEWMASFPEDVNHKTQYGKSVRAMSVYLSQFQLIPQLRVVDYFKDQMGLPISKASVQNFNEMAFKKLEEFELWAKNKLFCSLLNCADETGVNVNGKKLWFHLLSNDEVVLYQVDKKRGLKAMIRMGVLPNYKGTLVHDHWKSYYFFDCKHALCNAHHIRELQRAWEQDGQKWAQELKALLLEINKAVQETKEQKLEPDQIISYQQRYRSILENGSKECPLAQNNAKPGPTKQSKARNLLDRLDNYQEDVLRFMKESIVPFTNNMAENDLRMTKVQQKISGCFRSLNGAKVFCRIRSYLLTCKRHGIEPTQALNMLFDGNLPDFMDINAIK